MTLALTEGVCLVIGTHLCSGELSIISSSCATSSRTSTVAPRTCRRRLTPDIQREVEEGNHQ